MEGLIAACFILNVLYYKRFMIGNDIPKIFTKITARQFDGASGEIWET